MITLARNETLCLHFANFGVHMFYYQYWSLFIYKYTKLYIYIYIYRMQKQNMGLFLKRLSFVWLIQFLKKKKRDRSKFSWLALLTKHFFIENQPNMSEQEKKFNAETMLKKNSEIIEVSMSTEYKAKKYFDRKNFLRKRGSGGLNKKTKRRLFNCFCNGD